MRVAFVITTVDPKRRSNVRDLVAAIRLASPDAWVGIWSAYTFDPVPPGVNYYVPWVSGHVPSYPVGLNRAFRTVEREVAEDVELYVKVDDDIRVTDREWFENLVRGHGRHPRGILGAKLLRPDGRLQHAGGFILRTGSGALAGHYGEVIEVNTLAVHTERPVEFVTGAFFAIPRRVWDAVGPFEDAWGGWEDSEYCFRARSRGFETWYLPDVVLEHGTGQEERAEDPERAAAYAELMRRCAAAFAARYLR